MICDGIIITQTVKNLLRKQTLLFTFHHFGCFRFVSNIILQQPVLYLYKYTYFKGMHYISNSSTSSLVSMSITKIDLKLSTKFHSMLEQTRMQRRKLMKNEMWLVDFLVLASHFDDLSMEISQLFLRWYRNLFEIVRVTSGETEGISNLTNHHHLEWNHRLLVFLLLPKCNREMTKFLFFHFKHRHSLSSWTF